MNFWLIAVLVVVGIFALLLARGMYLIGSGSDAELEARQKMSGDVSRTGWATLDSLRNGDVPVVTWLEEKLGLNDGDDDE